MAICEAARQVETHASVFFVETLGWIAAEFCDAGCVTLSFNHATRGAALACVGHVTLAASSEQSELLRRALGRYAAGEVVDLQRLPVVVQAPTVFARRVIAACRSIPYGSTRSYAALAQAAGSPRAARAVGTVMARNPLPLLVPCHRVIGAHGGLGGYSARGGLAVKQRLLRLEQIGVEA